MGWLVFDLTGSAFMVGVVFAVRSAPSFFLGALSGVVADRLERRLLLRFITLCSSIVAGLTALLLLTDAAQVWTVIALVGVAGGFFVFAQTIAPAYAYDIVGPGHALNCLSLIAMSNQAGGLAGVLIGGALIGVVGPAGRTWPSASATWLPASCFWDAQVGAGATISPRVRITEPCRLRPDRPSEPCVIGAYVSGIG